MRRGKTVGGRGIVEKGHGGRGRLWLGGDGGLRWVARGAEVGGEGGGIVEWS